MFIIQAVGFVIIFRLPLEHFTCVYKLVKPLILKQFLFQHITSLDEDLMPV